MIQALQSHHVNTLVELRRIERAFAVLGSPDVTEPMTAACKCPADCKVIWRRIVADSFSRVILRQFSQSAY